MAQVRMILIAVVVLVMGGIGYMQYSAMRLASSAIDAAEGATDGDYEDYAESTYEKPQSYGNVKAGSLIKSTKTSSRVGGDKTITIQRKAPSLWIRIKMWFGYKPEDAHRRDFARLKEQREREAASSKGVNTVTGRKESTANSSSSATASGGTRRAAPNKTVASALGN